MGNLKSKARENPTVKKIVDREWDRFVSVSGSDHLGVQDLYCAVLLVYNDINKTLPGPFHDPPTREEVEAMLKTFDRNNDGVLDRMEFTAFLERFTKTVSARVSSQILIFSIVIPTLVVLSRRGAEQVPRVGDVVRRIPHVLYSSAVTTLIVFVGSQFRKM